MNTNQEYVWYVGYGSNLNKQRFLCYILGGTPKYGCKSNQGCINKALPGRRKKHLIGEKEGLLLLLLRK